MGDDKSNRSSGAELRYKKVCRKGREVSIKTGKEKSIYNSHLRKSRRNVTLRCFISLRVPGPVEAGLSISCWRGTMAVGSFKINKIPSPLEDFGTRKDSDTERYRN